MWDVRACRSCLAVKCKLKKIGEAAKRQFTAITGLQILENGYPTYFCMECRHHIKKSLAFRRKSRRAHFVLKEIMAVRKQISYSDIVTVNRKKANLESSLNYWEPKHNACYLIANQEGQEEDGLQKYDLATLNFTRTHSTHLVEIEPEGIESIETPDETNEANGDKDDETFNDADVPTNDYLETGVEATDIDMNDIFKDLNDNNDEPDDNDDGVEELKLPEREKRKRRERDELSGSNHTLKTLLEVLVLYDVKILSLEEQKEKMEYRRKAAPFVYAYYKCAICLTVHTSMQELLQHVQFHNDRKFDHECVVCRNKLPTAEDLAAHIANYHMYEYQCRICQFKVYSQADTVKHAKFKHTQSETDNFQRKQKRKKKVVKSLKMFTITPLTQSMMYEVMKLSSRAGVLRGAESDQVDPNVSGFKNGMRCDICGLSQKDRHDMEKHMTLKHRFMYTCKLCKEVFTTRKQALDHVETHDNKYECADCGKEFDKNTAFREHRKSAHIQTKIIPCNLCGHTGKNEKLFYRHQLRQHGYISLNDPLIGDPQYKCEQCAVQFVDKRSLGRHLVNMNHTGAENVELACVPCKKLFDEPEQLETHYITCHHSRKYPRNCCYCSEVLHNAREYKNHYFRQHPTLPYRYVSQNCICDVCGKSVFQRHLQAHMKIHSGDAYECRLCNYMTSTPVRHVAHVLNCHAVNPYLCALCPRRFKHRFNCKEHVLKVHAPTKLYKCEFCAAEFSYFRNLKKHSITLHNLVIPSVKTSFLLKSNSKLFVYAHMRIEINELERPTVEKIDVELVDYLELKSKPVDYKNYFIFNPDAEENVYYKKKIDTRPFRTKKKVNQTELEVAVAQIKSEALDQSELNGSTGIEPFELYDETKMEYKQVKGEDMEVDSEMQEIKQTEMEKVELMEMNEVESLEVDSGAPFADNVLPPEDSATPAPLEVIESEGHQYVMIDGEMYRIACEDEEV